MQSLCRKQPVMATETPLSSKTACICGSGIHVTPGIVSCNILPILYRLPAYVQVPLQKSQHKRTKMESVLPGKALSFALVAPSVEGVDVNQRCKSGWFGNCPRFEEGLLLRPVDKALPEDVKPATTSSTFFTCYVLITWFVRLACRFFLGGQSWYMSPHTLHRTFTQKLF
jgi:hypothetical protein